MIMVTTAIGFGLVSAAWFLAGGKGSPEANVRNWQDDLRGRYLEGLMGTGKTTMILVEIMAHLKEGRNVIFIDIANSCRKLLDLLPADIDLVYVAPWYRSNRKVGFNVLHRHLWNSQERHNIAGNLIATLQKLYPMSWGDVIGTVLYYATLTVLELTEASEIQVTIKDVYRFFTMEPEERQAVLECLNNYVIRSYFQRNMEKLEKSGSWESATRKLADIIENDLIADIFAHPDGHNLVEMMNGKGRLICFDLDTVELNPSASITAAALALTTVQNAVLSRPQETSPPCVLFLDEFQEYATDSILTLLSQARKYQVATVLAHQTNSGQLTGQLSKAVGMAATHMYFRLTDSDAKPAASHCGTKEKKIFDLSDINRSMNTFVEGLCGRGPGARRDRDKPEKWEPEDFTNLSNYTVIHKDLIWGVVWSAKKEKLPEPPPVQGNREELIAKSLSEYGRLVTYQEASFYDHAQRSINFA